MACPSCGNAAPDGAHFCPSCGADLFGRHDERRVVTVLFADIVGFTTLSESLDPERVKNVVDQCFERMVDDITAYGGVVDKIIGDAIVALFGAPLAHEDDAERAVRAGLQIHRTLRDLQTQLGVDVRLRVGVNTGEVLVGALRAGGDYTAMGDVVNTAQRLESSARPGTVLVGRATWMATNEVIRYESVGLVDAKGKEEPVEAWEARAVTQPPGYRVRRHTPLIGRDAELGLLRHAIGTTVERRRAHLILLLGEAGVGKTRLAEEVAELARVNHEAIILEGRCVPYGEANVWWPVAEALRQATGTASDADLEAATAAVSASVVDILGMAPESPDIERIVQGALYLLGYEGTLRGIEPARARDEASRALLAFVEAAARTRPVVIVLSDLHWADDVVLELIDDLMEHLGRERVVVVATARQELNERWSARSGRHNELVVNVDPLDRDAASDLLGVLLESDLPDDVRDLLLDRSGGNPFFLEELVALVGDTASGDTLEPHVLLQGPLADLPDTLRGLVAARLDALTPAEKHTLEDAAVWGRSGPLETLHRMAASMRGTTDLTEVLDGLVAKDVLTVEGHEWSFRSDLVRDVAYSTLTKADRARRHYGIAHYLDSMKNLPQPSDVDERLVDTIGHHYGAAADLVAEMGPIKGVGDDVTDAALRWVAEAARRAELGQVLPMAARLFSQCLRLVGTDHPELRTELLLSRARVRSELREVDDARADIDEARRLAEHAGDRSSLARADLVLGELAQRTGDHEQALAILQRSIDGYRALDEPFGMADALRALGMTHLFHSDNDAAEVAISEALETSRALGDQRGEAWAVQQLAWISFLNGRATEAEERLLTAVQIFKGIGDTGGLGWARGLLAYVMYLQGRLDEARDVGDAVLREAHDRGDLWGEGMMAVLGASVRMWSGRALEAIPRAEAGLTLFRRISDGFGEVNSLAILGRSLVATGRIDEGFQHLDEAGGLTRSAKGTDFNGIGLTALASASVQIGEPHRASVALEGIDARWLDHTNIPDVECLVAMGLTHLQLGRVDQAVECLERASVEEPETTPSPYATAALALALAAASCVEEVLDLDKRVNDMSRATYLDKGTAKLAAILVRARRGDADAASRFDAVVRGADGTDDVVAQAVSRLTQAYGLEAMGAPEAPAVRSDAERRLAALGIEADGWRRAIELVLAAAPESQTA